MSHKFSVTTQPPLVGCYFFYANFRKLTANYPKIIVVYILIKEFTIKFTDNSRTFTFAEGKK